MRARLMPMALAVAAATALSGFTFAGADVPGAARAPGHGRPALTASWRQAASGDQLWARRYNGPGNAADGASAMAVSPRGDTVFVTGHSTGAGSGLDFATVAYSAASGARLWAQRYSSPGDAEDTAASVAVSPAGDMVFVTGKSFGTSDTNIVTLAYDAATGAPLWTRLYGPGSAGALAVSPDGKSVFVTGQVYGNTNESYDYLTLGYDTATGSLLWAQRYNGPGNWFDGAGSIAVSPTSGTVFVTGGSVGRRNPDYATIAYNAATGAQLWLARYHGPGDSSDSAHSVAVSPGGGTVFVTGESAALSTGWDYATVAYDTATGAQLWARRYNRGYDIANSVAVSPRGDAVFVTGQSENGQAASGYDYATVGYNAVTGATLWVRRYNGAANTDDYAVSVATGPAGDKVLVAGTSARQGIPAPGKYATIAYNAVTGATLWLKWYNPGQGDSHASAVAVSPDGNTVFVAGESQGGATGADYATIAYRA